MFILMVSFIVVNNMKHSDIFNKVFPIMIGFMVQKVVSNIIENTMYGHSGELGGK